MRFNLIEVLRRAAHWLSIEREVILRSRGRMRYLRFGRLHFVAAGLSALAVTGWSGFVSYQYIAGDAALAERDKRAAEIVEINENLRWELESLQGNLSQEQRALAKTNASKARVISELQERLSLNETASEALQKKLAATQAKLASLDNDRQSLTDRYLETSEEVARLNEVKESVSGERAELAEKLRQANERLEKIAGDRSRLGAERDALNQRVAALGQRLEKFEESQTESIARLGERAGQSIKALERTLVVAGLDIDRILGRMAEQRNGDGVGGPLLAVEDAPGGEVALQLAAVEQRVDRLQGMQELMRRLPLAVPLDEYRVTSRFGRRFDPFNGELAMHTGTDFAGRTGMPVRVTAPGVVTFVGWKGGFGKMVEVDHGLGIRTRYGHMSRLFVERGQKLEFREKVGLVGSTGRSTAPHLHYEVLVDGRPTDPGNFMRAGQYVFKN